MKNFAKKGLQIQKRCYNIINKTNKNKHLGG
nr:MAG TPA: hypothetical protein [Caudoviricetes sp.]